MNSWDSDPWDDYPELRHRALVLFQEQQAEKEATRGRLPVWRRAVFRVARFLARYFH